MKLQKLNSEENGGVLITWSKRAVDAALSWLRLGIMIGLTFLIAKFLRWLGVALGIIPH